VREADLEALGFRKFLWLRILPANGLAPVINALYSRLVMIFAR